MDQFLETIQQDLPILVDFYADWCGPCQTMEPVVTDVETYFGEKIKVIRIDVDKQQALTANFKIQSVPTFILFKNGEVHWKRAGLLTRSEIKKQINRIL